jgi:prepilin-type processing-associated H-X9-DG protein
MQAMFGYAAEFKGSMPYGFYYATSNQDPFPGTWNNAGDGSFISWPSLVGKYVNKSAGDNRGRLNFPSIVRCPEADQNWPHVVSYAANMIVCVSPRDELRVGAYPSAQLKPPLMTQMLKETAVVWDTAIQPDWGNNVGFLIGADIDGQRFWSGASTPQFRYFSPNDPFGQFPPFQMSNNAPVRLNVGSNVFTNVDPPEDSHFPWQGNLRFRHNRETQCNVGYADGHVAAYTAKTTSDRKVKSHDALRRYFMIKWPTGVSPDPGSPF